MRRGDRGEKADKFTADGYLEAKQTHFPLQQKPGLEHFSFSSVYFPLSAVNLFVLHNTIVVEGSWCGVGGRAVV